MYRTQLREDRESGNQKRRQQKYLTQQERLNEHNPD
jgi:hypothetical protein